MNKKAKILWWQVTIFYLGWIRQHVSETSTTFRCGWIQGLKRTKISLYLSLYCGTLCRKSPPTLWHFHQQLQGYTLSVLKPTGKRMLSFLDSPIDLNWSQFPFVWMGSRSKQSLWPAGWSRLTRVGLVNMSIPGAGATVNANQVIWTQSGGKWCDCA